MSYVVFYVIMFKILSGWSLSLHVKYLIIHAIKPCVKIDVIISDPLKNHYLHITRSCEKTVTVKILMPS